MLSLSVGEPYPSSAMTESLSGSMIKDISCLKFNFKSRYDTTLIKKIMATARSSRLVGEIGHLSECADDVRKPPQLRRFHLSLITPTYN